MIFRLRNAGRCLILFQCSLLISCSPKNLSFELSGSDSISGSVSGFASFGLSKPGSLSSTCLSEKVKLYSINSGGQKDELLLETEVDENGNFQFNGLRSAGLDSAISDLNSTKYLLEFDCDDTLYQRFVTGHFEQNLAESTTLLSWLAQTSASNKVNEQNPSIWNEFYIQLSSVETMTEAFSTLNTNTALKNRFENIFGITLNELLNAAPKIRTADVPLNHQEGVSKTLSVVSVHWSADYEQVYSWRLGTDTLSTSNNFSFTPSANSQGTHALQLFIGQDNGSGLVDTSKPYIQKIFDISISNDIPPTPPPMMRLSSQYTDSTSAQVQINTGSIVDGRAVNCHSFSKLAITEESAPAVGIAPILFSSYTIDCDQTPTQNINLTLSGVEGERVLRLWAMDASGNRSNTSSDVSVTYDATNPALTLTSLNGGENLAGNQSQNITYTLTESNPTANPITIEYSADHGVSWNTIVSNTSNTGSYNWTVPSIDSNQVLIRISAMDLAGNFASIQSANTFTIDSSPPNAPVITRTSPILSKDQVTTFEVQNCTDHPFIYVTESPSTPDGTEAGWQTCNTLNPYSFTVSGGDGLKTISVWAKDLAGNVSSSAASYSVTLDQTAPAIALTSHNDGAFQGGALTTLTWSATDTHWGSGTIDIQASQNNGGTWSDLAIGTTNDGSHGFVLPSVDNNQYRIKVKGCDEAGNCSEATSINALTIDVTAPVISSFEINDGAVYAGTTLTAVKAEVTDNFTTPTDIQVRTGNAHAVTGDCQSEYNDSGWISYTNATTAISHQLTPTDGVKKVCIWAKDTVGNVTVYSPTVGTDGVDTDTIIFEVGNPPVITSFNVTRNLGGTSTSIGDAMTIAWDVSDAEGLNNNPVSFSYTTDNLVWKDIFTDGDISDPLNITWIGGLSGHPTTANGVVHTWTAPSNNYFRMRVVARDQSGNSSIPILSQMFNTGNWSVYAGSRDRGVGGSGLSAALFGSQNGPQAAIDPLTGDIYASDERYGIKKLDVKTGLVSTVIKIGANNLPDDGPLPSDPALNSSYLYPKFDSKGRLYIVAGNTDSKIYQIDFAANHVRHYAGGGSNSDGGAPATSLHTTSTFTFDESDNMYVVTMCAPYTFPRDQGKRVVKIAQNPDGSPGATTRIIGDCTYATPQYGGSAHSSPAGTFPYPQIADLLVFNNGNTIYFWGYNSTSWKIVDGTVYSVSFGGVCGLPRLTYNPNNGKIYRSNATCGIDEVTLGGPQNGGEISSTLFDGNVLTPGCTDDGIPISSACTKVSWLQSFNNTLYFADGIAANSPSSYRIRYIDGDSEVRSVFGSLPFFGDGMNRSVIRSSVAGIYYKRATEPNQSAFPEGLYFMDSNAGVFARIDPTTEITEVLWGNQARQSGGYADGDTISKDLSMGAPYQGGSLMPLNFDSTGLPWLRVSHTLVKINASKQIEFKTSNSGYWHDLAEGADPSTSSLASYAARAGGFTLKDQALFLIGAGYINVGVDPNISLRLLDFDALTTTKLLGGNHLYSENQSPSPDLGGGLPSAPLWYGCYNSCFTFYDPSSDRLYFSEQNKIRYVTTPSNTATSTLGTLFQSSHTIYNFTFTPDGSQVWYMIGSTNTLRCKDISSGKSWCDDSTNHFQAAKNAGLSFNHTGANIFTWKDNDTLFLSTYQGEILQFDLPSGP